MKTHFGMFSSSREVNRKSQMLFPFAQMTEKHGGVPTHLCYIIFLGIFHGSLWIWEVSPRSTIQHRKLMYLRYVNMWHCCYIICWVAFILFSKLYCYMIYINMSFNIKKRNKICLKPDLASVIFNHIWLLALDKPAKTHDNQSVLTNQLWLQTTTLFQHMTGI